MIISNYILFVGWVVWFACMIIWIIIFGKEWEEKDNIMEESLTRNKLILKGLTRVVMILGFILCILNFILLAERMI